MFSSKIPKSQKPPKTPYTSYNPHSRPLSERRWNQGYYRVVSIDPSGRSGKNFGFRVEKRPGPGDYGFITPDLFLRYSIPTINKTAEDDCLNLTYDFLTQFLDSNLTLFMESHIILIERQLPENYCAVRFAQHILTYFLVKLKDAPLLPLILEINSKLKLKELGIPSGLPKKEYKGRLVEKAKELLTKRGDDEGVKLIIKSKCKPDDICDCVCQIEAVFSYFKWPLTQERKKLTFKRNTVDQTSEISVTTSTTSP